MSNQRKKHSPSSVTMERMCPKRKPGTKKLQKGTPRSHIVFKGEDKNFEYYLHATKGYRCYKK